MIASTKDIGLALRDLMGNQYVSQFTKDAIEGYREHKQAFRIDFIDVSDPHNPKIMLDNGQVFTVRIFAK